jgi:hypothetical protein
MSHEQAFEEQSQASLPVSHRQWQHNESVEPDFATMIELYEVMASVNQRLAEYRVKPLKRTIGDTVVWASTALILLSALDNIFLSSITIVTPLLATVHLYNRNLHRLDRANAALSLQEYDKRWIGPLFEALSWPNRRIRDIVRLKLLHLLPLMTEDDGKYLLHKHRRAIYSVLEDTRDTVLKVAILKAIPRFGDTGSLALVERLASTRAWTPDGIHVRRAALISLPLVREHALKMKDSIAQLERIGAPYGPMSLLTESGTGERADSSDLEPVTLPVPANYALTNLEAERVKVARPAMRVAFLAADWCIIVPFCVYQTVSYSISHQVLLGAVWAGATVAATQLYRVALSSKRVAMLRKQAMQRDIKAVGMFAEALSWPETDLQYEAASALTVLLPLLKANHAALLSTAQRECLHEVLTLKNARTHADLIVAILKAFQQVGDTAAIPVVERLANARPFTAQERKIVAEAQECLPYLHLCAVNNSASHSLLRASSQGGAAAADNLLRPAWENPEIRPEQLLRPGNKDSL